MKFDLEDLRYVLIWFPWEIVVGCIGAFLGWPFRGSWSWVWFPVGTLMFYLYKIRKNLML